MGSYTVRLLHASGRVTHLADTDGLVAAVEAATLVPVEYGDIVTVEHCERGLVWAKGFGNVWQAPQARHCRTHPAVAS